MRSRPAACAVCSLALVLACCVGCGRKLPPLPPGAPEPVVMVSADFRDGEVVIKARCNVAGARVTLLGKPKGICPSCTDDLTLRDERLVEEAGSFRLVDPEPEAAYMVYRLGLSRGTLVWMTEARVVRE